MVVLTFYLTKLKYSKNRLTESLATEIATKTQIRNVEDRVGKLKLLLHHKERLLSEAHSRILDGGVCPTEYASAQFKVGNLAISGRQIRRLETHRSKLLLQKNAKRRKKEKEE